MIKDLQDKIILLYDTILGKFSFFRQFLKLLLDFDRNVKELEFRLDDLKLDNDRLSNEIGVLKEKIQELSKPNSENSKNFSRTSASQLMSDLYTESLK